MRPLSTGELIQHELDVRDIHPERLRRELGLSRPEFSLLLNGELKLTPILSAKLSKFFGEIYEAFWWEKDMLYWELMSYSKDPWRSYDTIVNGVPEKGVFRHKLFQPPVGVPLEVRVLLPNGLLGPVEFRDSLTST